MQNFTLNRMVLFLEGVIGQKKHEPHQKPNFFEKNQKFFLSGFAMLSVLALKMVVLESELNSASNGVKKLGGHRAKNFRSPSPSISGNPTPSPG